MNILTIAAIICVALNLLSFFYLKWYVKKRTTFTELDDRQAELSQSLKQSGMLIAEIDSITDRDSQLIEDRINKLKEILRDVDKRVETYEKELENFSRIEERINKNAPKNETLYTSLGRGIRAAFTETEFLSVNETFMPPSPADNSQNAPQIKSVKMPVSDIPAKETPAENPQKVLTGTPSKKQLRGFIDNLANEGLPPEEIAKQLNISVAEVNLAMNLRRKN
ncbi:MAG: hypothetical protein FWC21_03465 [Treponema sp.]|nr:hypothetical protein [Treponema sp.]